MQSDSAPPGGRPAGGDSRFAGAAAFADWNVETDEVVWSAPLEDILGEPIPETPVSLEWWRGRIHPEDRGEAVGGAEGALGAGRDRYAGAYRVRRSDGGYAPIREEGFVVRVEGRPVRVVAAIFAAHLAPSSGDASRLFSWLEQDRERFRTFIDGLPLLAWAMTPEGWIYFYNRRWYEYTGTTAKRMEGWGWIDVHDPRDLPRMLGIFRRALAAGTFWEDEFRLRRADGAMRWHLSRAMPLRDRDGRVIHWFGTNTDVHDQKLALEERSRLLEREQEARRSAEATSRAKDEFLATVSHELRSPLNAVVGWASVLQHQALTPLQQKAVDAIARNAQQQATLIEDLLDTTRILSGKLKIHYLTTPIAPPIRAAVEAVLPAAQRRGVAVAVTDRSNGAQVVGDAARLQQIAENLLSNAVKFSPENGRVDVRIAEEGDVVAFEVVDEGEGIDPQFLPRIFGRFEQADSSSRRRHGGLGLGLSIVRHLVELHRGTIRASSAGRGRGASFRVELASAQSGSKVVMAESPADPEEADASLRGVSVLLVDDDGEAREVLSTLLLARGASVTAAGSVGEALESLRADVPDVVLSDIAMPEVDGFGLLERVRGTADARVAQLPVVALTAFASLSDRNQALESGFDAYLTKPVDAGRLARTLADAVARAALRSLGGAEQR